MSKMKGALKTAIIFLFLMVFVAAGISIFSKASKTSFVYRSKEPLKIGATYMTLNNPFFSIIDEEIHNVVEANGDVLISLDPALDLEKQKQQIQYLIDQNVQAIIVNPVDFNGLTSSLEAAKKAGIPVIAVDSEVMDSDLITYSVMSNNYDAGVQCAKDMMKYKKKADIVLLQHSTAYSAVQRIQGFIDTIKNDPNYRIVERIECDGQLEIAMSLMQKFLEKDVSFDVVMALNDPSALGALAAMQDQGKLKDVFVYGVDGTPETKTLISEHIMQATVAQSPKTLGKMAAEAVYKIRNHEKIEKLQRIPVTIITQKNVGKYSLEGWQ